MRSRNRRIVILGPPLVIVLAAGAFVRTAPQVIAGGPPRPIAAEACARPASTSTRSAADTAGTWWSQRPTLDGNGALTGWNLEVGSPRTATMSLDLPAGSIVSGPDRGRVVATADDGDRSTIRVVEAFGQCLRSLPLNGMIARRAVLVPAQDEALVHLLDRGTRRDRGIWRVPLDGSQPRIVLSPVADDLLRRVGIAQVWTTELSLSVDGARLGVQSCDPLTCVSRVLDLAEGSITVVDGQQGSLIGIAGNRLITRTACLGTPCDIVAWDLWTLKPTKVAGKAVGAALTGNGQLVVGVGNDDGDTDAIAIDLTSGDRRHLGRLEAGFIPQGGSSTAGIESLSDAVGLTRSGGSPTTLAIDPPSAQPPTQSPAQSPAQSREARP